MSDVEQPGHRPARYGPAIGEPPPAVDPRRWGSLIGVAGGLVFVFGYSAALRGPVSTLVRVGAVGLAVVAVVAHYVSPVALGRFAPARPVALVTYVACVLGELALIAVGTRALKSAGRLELRPALIAAVVGLHFIPFGWAFGERMFYRLGAGVLGAGVIGLLLAPPGWTAHRTRSRS